MRLLPGGRAIRRCGRRAVNSIAAAHPTAARTSGSSANSVGRSVGRALEGTPMLWSGNDGLVVGNRVHDSDRSFVAS